MYKRSLLAVVPLALVGLLVAPDADATRTLQDYRYFRALSIDLNGRMPTRAEIAAFEQDSFDVDAWIEQHLTTSAYADRLARIYMDLLRLEIGTTFQYVPQLTTLRRYQILGPNGQPMYVYFRRGQRRMHTDPTRMDTDGDFCLTPTETGLQFPSTGMPIGTATPVSQTVLDTYTVTIRPWWLYRDYASANPTQRFDATSWATMFPGFAPTAGLQTEPDGMTPTQSIVICKEEAQTADTGTIWVSGRTSNTLPAGRLYAFPSDSSYAKNHVGQPIACEDQTGFSMAADCGCGVGLERCMPGDSYNFDPNAFHFPYYTPIGFDQPTDQQDQQQSSWSRFWWSQEAIHFINDIFAEDRDFRDMLASHATYVNGPLAQFYRYSAGSSCCGSGVSFGYTQPQPLFDPANLPTNLLPQDTSTWVRVADRGPNASGIMTMPIFLTKFGSRRGRAHVLYNAFLCRDFVAGNVQLLPSTDPNLMTRQGCNTCHATLEPLAAYFSRVIESDWTYLPASNFPVLNPTCAGTDPSMIHSYCASYYDPAFTDSMNGTLRGAYPDIYAPAPDGMHSALGPAGLANLFMNDPAYAPVFQQCVVTNIAQSFLGRQLSDEDNALVQQLLAAFQPDSNGALHVRGLVRAMVHADAYRNANDESSTQARAGGAQ